MLKKKTFPLESGERLLLEAQGASKQESRAGWKLGHLFLTDRRVGSQTGSRISLNIPLDNIRSVTVRKRPFILCSKNVIILTCAPSTERGVSSRFWLITNDLETWCTRLYQMTQLKVDEGAIGRLAAALDPEAAAILWHLWHKSHANIDKLARLIDAECHSDVLLKIKAQINPLAVEQMGCPVLIFLPHALDPRTGEDIPFSWWIAGRREGKHRKDKSASGEGRISVDVFDEDTHVDVVAELPGIREEDVLLGVRGGKLVISGASATGKFREEAPLPAGVDAGRLTSRLNNGILLVRVQRPRAWVGV